MLNNSHILINVSHSSVFIPEEEKKYYSIEDIDKEVNLMTDHFTDDLFDTGDDRIICPVSRIVCDVERFYPDDKEYMSERGMGAIYTNDHNGNVLREISEEHKAKLLKTYYYTYHTKLIEMTKDKLTKFGKCLIVDAHSFPAKPLPYEIYQNPDRADICIGTDYFHTPEKMYRFLKDFFQSLGYSVSRNRPFEGTIVPFRYYKINANVFSVMIEINRGLYLDDNFNKKEEYGKIKQDIGTAIAFLREMF